MTRLTVSQAADQLGVSKAQLRRLMAEGLPIGEILQNATRKTYLIYQELIDTWKGKTHE